MGGPTVEAFEKDFASFCDSPHCVGVGSGTDALRFALIAAGIQPGDIVVTVPNTFIATAEAITQAGGRPVFVDVDERTYNMDPEKLRGYSRGRVRTGQSLVSWSIPPRGDEWRSRRPRCTCMARCADMDAILELAALYKLVVIEDACQAHGAEYFSSKENCWKKAGSMGRAAAFSFYPGKNLGALRGASWGRDNRRCRTGRKPSVALRDHGQAKKYYHDLEGYNGRLDAIQAGILRVKLQRLPAWNAARRKCARSYEEMFATGASEDIVLPYEPAWTKAVYHLYVVRVQDRDGLQKGLGEAGIGAGIHYPVPLHLQRAYAGLKYVQGDFPVCEKAATEILSLPMYPGLGRAEQSEVVAEVRAFIAMMSTGEQRRLEALALA